MAPFKPVQPDEVTAKKGVPVCPNHGEPLEGVPRPAPRKGNGRCPISKVMFAYEIDTETGSTEYAKDAHGNLVPVPVYKLTGDDK